jgi:hypothetical protein
VFYDGKNWTMKKRCPTKSSGDSFKTALLGLDRTGLSGKWTENRQQSRRSASIA